MARYFDFSRLIKKYSTAFEAITLTDGYYDECGDWIESTKEKTTVTGAIIAISERKIYQSNGTLTANDRQLYMEQPLDSKLQGCKVIYDGKVFSIEESTENAKFTGVYSYTLKYISAFKDKSGDYDITYDVETLEKRLDGVNLEIYERKTPESAILPKKNERLEKRLDGILTEDYDDD